MRLNAFVCYAAIHNTQIREINDGTEKKKNGQANANKIREIETESEKELERANVPLFFF